MAVHVDEVSSSVDAEPEQSPVGDAAGNPWDRLAEFRAMRARAAEDSLRTRAEGFDD